MPDIDYEALAKQAQSTPTPETIDYEALAKQAQGMPVQPKATSQNWNVGDYAKTAGRALWNLPGDIVQIPMEMASTGVKAANALLPWNIKDTAGKIVRGTESAAKTGAGEMTLALQNLGVNVQPQPGKEQETADMIEAAKKLNSVISNSAISNAVQGDFGPLMNEVADRPAHALLNVMVASKSLAGLMEKAGYADVAANLNKVEQVVNPLTMPKRAVQATASALKSTGEKAGVAAEMGYAPKWVGNVGEGVNKFVANAPQAVSNFLPRVASAATNWAGNVLHPENAYLNKIYKEDLEAARGILSTTPMVSKTGSHLTPAERTLSLHRVEATAGEAEVAGTIAPSEWSRREAERVKNLSKQIDPQSTGLAEAEKIRKENASEAFEPVDKQPVVVDAKFKELMNRPAMKAAFKQAQETAENKNKPFGKQPLRVKSTLFSSGAQKIITPDATLKNILSRPTTQDAIALAEKNAQDFGTKFGSYAPTKNAMGVVPERRYTGKDIRKLEQSLQNIKTPAAQAIRKELKTWADANVKGYKETFVPEKVYRGEDITKIKTALDELIRKPAWYGKEDALRVLKSDLLKWADEKVPGYGAARQQYITDSQAINRIRLSKYMQDLVSDVHNPAGEKKFLEYWEDIKSGKEGAQEKLIKDATKSKIYTELEGAGKGKIGLNFTKEDIARFDKIAADLKTRREYARQASAGAGADIQVGEKITGLPHTLSAEGVMANTFLRLKGEALSKKAAASLAKLAHEKDNAKILDAFDKAIKAKNKPALSAIVAKLRQQQIARMAGRATKAYSTVRGQAVKNAFAPRAEPADSANAMAYPNP
jgi:hypothetical protein